MAKGSLDMTMAKGMISPGITYYDQELNIPNICIYFGNSDTQVVISSMIGSFICLESELNTVYLNSGAQKSPGP